jgi:hypothetical protein
VAAGGNPDAIKIAIEPELNAAVTRAVEEQMKHLGGVLIAGVEQGNKTLENQAKRAATEFRRTEKAAENLGRAVHGMDDGINGAMGAINKQVEGLLNLFGRLNRAVDENVAATRSATEVARRGSIERTNVVSDAARKEIENTRRASSAYIVEQQRETSTARSAALERIQQSRNEGRLSVVAAQAAAKRRILITQALTQTIGRLEKGLGAAIAATARTAVSAFSKAFDALKTRGGGFAGAVREQNADLARELRRTNSVVETNTKEINNSFVEGTSRSLNQREDIIRRSFIEQEQIIRRSTVRPGGGVRQAAQGVLNRGRWCRDRQGDRSRHWRLGRRPWGCRLVEGRLQAVGRPQRAVEQDEGRVRPVGAGGHRLLERCGQLAWCDPSRSPRCGGDVRQPVPCHRYR